jgi:hypothetical protein
MLDNDQREDETMDQMAPPLCPLNDPFFPPPLKMG